MKYQKYIIGNITKINDLIYAGVKLVSERISIPSMNPIELQKLYEKLG